MASSSKSTRAKSKKGLTALLLATVAVGGGFGGYHFLGSTGSNEGFRKGSVEDASSSVNDRNEGSHGLGAIREAGKASGIKATERSGDKGDSSAKEQGFFGFMAPSAEQRKNDSPRRSFAQESTSPQASKPAHKARQSKKAQAGKKAKGLAKKTAKKSSSKKARVSKKSSKVKKKSFVKKQKAKSKKHSLAQHKKHKKNSH